MGARRKPRILWPRAAALVLGLSRGCLSGAVPPSVPPGWSVHFQEDTPYFHNEKTGETTWEQPRLSTTPTPPTTAAQAPEQTSGSSSSSSSRGEPPLLPSSRLPPHPAQTTTTPTTPRDRRRRPPTEHQRGSAGKRGWFGFGRGAENPQQQEQQQQQQPWQSRGVTPPGGTPSQEQWQGTDGQGWINSARGAQSHEEEHAARRRPPGPERKAFPGEDLRALPGASATYDEQQKQVPATGWGEESSGGSGGGGGVGAPEVAGERPSGEWWGAAANSVAAPGGAGAAENAQGTDQRAGYSAGEGAAGRGAQNLVTDVPLPPGEAGGIGLGMQDATGRSAAEADGAGATGAAAAAAAAPPPKTGETAGEWFVPSNPEHGSAGASETPNAPSAWEAQTFGDSGVEGSQGDTGPGVGGADGPLGGTGAAGSLAGGRDAEERAASVPEQVWGSGHHPEPENQHQQQQQGQYGYDGMGHEAEGWDWADPWGQGAAWGAPAWGAGAEDTPKKNPADDPPLSHSEPTAAAATAAAATSTPDKSAYGSANAPPHSAPSAAGSGWGSGRGGGDADSHLKVDTSEVAPAPNASSVGAPGLLAGSDGRVETPTDVLEADSQMARKLAEAAKELEAARKAEQELRAALKEQEEAKASALAAAEKKIEAAEAFARQQAEQARENATAAGQWLVSLGLEQGELKEQLEAAQLNNTSLMEELSALKESAAEVQMRANSSEIRANSTEAELKVTKAELEVAKADVGLLDESLKQYMDGDGHHRPQQHSARGHPLSWRRVSTAYLRPLLPSKLKEPTPEELEAKKLNISLGRALENNTALAEAVGSKDDLIKDLNSRIKQFQLHAVRRKKGYRTLKLGLAELTDEVQAKESVLAILAVCMIGTYSILESMDSTIRAQQADIATILKLGKTREEFVQELTLELQSEAASCVDFRLSMHRTELGLSLLAVSLGAGEDWVQRWNDAVAMSIPISSGEDVATPDSPAGENDDPLAVLLYELHAAAARTFLSPLGLEPTTGAITVAVPRTALEGVGSGTVPARHRGFWGGLFDCLCCRRR